MIETTARILLVVIIAGLCSGAAPALFWSVDMDNAWRFAFAGKLILTALFGCLLIGLPIALELFAFVRRQPEIKPIHLVSWASLAATFLVIPISATGGTLGSMMFGIPLFIAANVFAVAGWFLVLKRMRARTSDR